MAATTTRTGRGRGAVIDRPRARELLRLGSAAHVRPVDPLIELPGFHPADDPSRSLRSRQNGIERAEVAAMQRARLIDAMVQAVAILGYESVGIREVCHQAGVALKTFYDHFQSKEELFLAAYDQGVEILFSVTSEAYLAGDITWQERVRVGLGTFLQALTDNPAFAKFFVVEIHKVGEAARARVDEWLEAAAGMFQNVQPAAGLNIPVEELVPLVVGAIYAETAFYIRTDRIAELPDLAIVLTNFSTRMFSAVDFGPQPE